MKISKKKYLNYLRMFQISLMQLKMIVHSIQCSYHF
nr:MAG TPA: hypothetical protein [Bacteriophage sp.]DAJ69705.1 MAG TPA: hypothetical protein [Caudoviricetes sp.]